MSASAMRNSVALMTKPSGTKAARKIPVAITVRKSGLRSIGSRAGGAFPRESRPIQTALPSMSTPRAVGKAAGGTTPNPGSGVVTPP